MPKQTLADQSGLSRIFRRGFSCEANFFANYLRFLCEIDQFFLGICGIIYNREGQEANHDKSISDTLPNLWGGAGREVRIEHGITPYKPAS